MNAKQLNSLAWFLEQLNTLSQGLHHDASPGDPVVSEGTLTIVLEDGSSAALDWQVNDSGTGEWMWGE